MEKTKNGIYDEFLENDNSQASKEVTDAYSSMNAVFDEYLSAVLKDMFFRAYTFGYANGRETVEAEMKKGGCHS